MLEGLLQLICKERDPTHARSHLREVQRAEPGSAQHGPGAQRGAQEPPPLHPPGSAGSSEAPRGPATGGGVGPRAAPSLVIRFQSQQL